MNGKLNLSLMMAALVLVSCRAHESTAQAGARSEVSPEVRAGLQNQALNSTLWQQTSAEYRALATQAYSVARRALDAGLADPKWTAALEQEGEYGKLPPAIILDIDETVLDTSTHQARLIREDGVYTDERFAAYVEEAAKPDKPAIPVIEGAR